MGMSYTAGATRPHRGRASDVGSENLCARPLRNLRHDARRRGRLTTAADHGVLRPASRSFCSIGTFAPLIMATARLAHLPGEHRLYLPLTFLNGVWIAPVLILLRAEPTGIVGNAGLLTGSSFAVLTGYAFVSRPRLQRVGRLPRSSDSDVLIATSFIAACSSTTSPRICGSRAEPSCCSAACLIFDTWRLRNVYGPDDYVPAAINIDLDLLNLFLAILRLLGGGQRRA